MIMRIPYVSAIIKLYLLISAGIISGDVKDLNTNATDIICKQRSPGVSTHEYTLVGIFGLPADKKDP